MATNNLRLCVGVLFLLAPAFGCQGANFGSEGGDQFSGTGKHGPQKSEDQKASGGKDAADGDDSDSAAANGRGDLGNNSAEDDDGEGLNDSDTSVAGPLPGSACRFFGKTQAAEVIPGGPPTPVKVAALNGTIEGDSYHFDLAAYQGCYGAEAKNNRGDPTPHTLSTYVSQITGAFFGAETGNAIGEASALGYQAQCGNANQWNLVQPKPYAVKHLYRGVVNGIHDANCVVQVQETENAFWVRENGDEYSGCFALGTKLRLADGTERVASLVVEGTELWNPLTKRAAKVTKVVIGPEKTIGMYEVGFGSRVVVVTSKHPFPTAAGLKMAQELLPTDKILGEDGKEHALTKLAQRPADPRQVVVNFIINPDSSDPRDHMVLADGVVTGDLHLQNQLVKDRFERLTSTSVPSKL